MALTDHCTVALSSFSVHIAHERAHRHTVVLDLAYRPVCKKGVDEVSHLK